MAFDFFHRLLVEGSPAEVRLFCRDIRREYPRAVGRKKWTQVVPFSLEALYALAPDARRLSSAPPGDPFDISVWPIRRLAPGVAEARYRFHTRNLEMQDLIRALSKARPSLVFTMSTLCLDTAEIDAYRLQAGTARHWCVSRRLYEEYARRERAKLKGNGEDVDAEAEDSAEQVLLDVALSHWRKSGSVRRLRWWNQETFRDMETELDLLLVEMEHSPRQRRASSRAQGAPGPIQNAPCDLVIVKGEVCRPQVTSGIVSAGVLPARSVQRGPPTTGRR